MKHELKIWPQYFKPVQEGQKNFEVRVNDRGYQAGDIVELNEWTPTAHEGAYTGRSLTFEIGYVFQLNDNRCVFSILKLKTLEGEK